MTDAPVHCAACGRPSKREICRTCSTRKLIGEIPELVADLDDTLTRQARGSRGVGGRSGERPLPFDDRPQIAAARSALGAVYMLAERFASDDWQALRVFDATVRAVWQRDHMPAARLAATLLGEFVTEWTNDVDLDAVRETVLVARNAVRAAVDRPVPRIYAGPCGARVQVLTLVQDEQGVLVPTVGRVACEGAIYARPDDLAAPLEAVLTCRACGAQHALPARHGVCLASFCDDVLPMPEILHCLALLTGDVLPVDLVRQWRARRRLVACLDHNRVETYRVADVLRLADREAVRPGPRRKGA